MFLRNDCRYLAHRLERCRLAPIIRGDIAILEACLKMRNVAAQNHRTSFRKPHEQRLVAGRVSGRREQDQASVAKNIVVAVDELYWMLLVKGDGIFARAPSPLVLSDSLHQHQRIKETFRYSPYRRSGWLCDTAIKLDVRGLNMYFFEQSRERYRFAPDRASARPPFVKHRLMIGQ